MNSTPSPDPGGTPLWSLDLPGVVELPDGRRIRGCGRERGQAPQPDLGVFLHGRYPGERDWDVVWIRWPDFRLPANTDHALVQLRHVHHRALAERVELSCGAGIGRTGTAIGVLAMLSGVPADQVIGWVRSHYHRKAVETRAQRRWLAQVARRLTS